MPLNRILQIQLFFASFSPHTGSSFLLKSMASSLHPFGFLWTIGVPLVVILALWVLKPSLTMSPVVDQQAADGISIPPTCPKLGIRYGIMMDAGSTGSRTHVYKFNFHANGHKELISEVFEEVKPGLSSYKDDPKAAANSLRPLMDIAVKEVPMDLTSCTPVAIKATAGLRLIGMEKSRDILAAVEAMFREYPFHVPDSDAAVVMDPEDEGAYAWLTVNFLLDRLDGAQTAATFDMGGASTQVVVIPDNAKDLEEGPESNIHQLHALGRKFTVYQHSYLGFGLMEALRKIKAIGDEEGLVAQGKFPCFASGDALATGLAALDFDQCLPYVHTILGVDAPCQYHSCAMQGVYQPDLNKGFSGDRYVFSYYYELLEDYIPADGKTTVGQYKAAGREVCSAAKTDEAAQKCLSLTYLYALLSQGFGLPDSTPLNAVKKINGAEVAWALGATLVEMD